MKNKPILFIDFDGTICFDRYWKSLGKEENEKVQDLLFRNDTTLVNKWMKGEYSAEEINRKISEICNIEYDYLWNVFVKDCKTMYIKHQVLEKINSLRQKYFIILITTNMDSFSRFTIENLKLDKYFDEISNSFYEKKFKTEDDGSLFLKFSDLQKVNIADCFLIDDSFKSCNIFSTLGGTSFLIQKDFNIEDYLDKL